MCEGVALGGLARGAGDWRGGLVSLQSSRRSEKGSLRSKP